MIKRVLSASLLIAAGIPAAASAQAAPPMGLYTCTEPSGYPDLTSYFGVLDGSIYANSEGVKGKYRFDSKTAMITMTSGPLAGSSYQRIPNTNTYLKQHRLPALACPHSPRDPRRYPW